MGRLFAVYGSPFLLNITDNHFSGGGPLYDPENGCRGDPSRLRNSVEIGDGPKPTTAQKSIPGSGWVLLGWTLDAGALSASTAYSLRGPCGRSRNVPGGP